jgi:hypothetical protein
VDLVITVAIVALLVAIILGSLRRGIQSLISFALLGLLAAFVVIRVSGESSASPGFLGIGQNGDAEPTVAETEFQDFSRSVGNYLDTRVISPVNGTSTALGNQGTDTGDAGTVTDPIDTPPRDEALGTDPRDANGTTDGATDPDNSTTPSNAGTREPVSAWW